MNSFKYKKNSFYCEDVSIEALARKHGTPLYIYSSHTLIDNFNKITNAFKSLKPLICYSVKASSNLSILKTLVSEGAGLDIVSGGELFRANKVKCAGKKIVYASVGKTDKEIKDAISSNILMFNVESLAELKKINAIADKLKRKVDVALRVNPDIEPKTHAYITTGKKETKFGLDIDSAKMTFLAGEKYKFVNLSGIHIHIGSQITSAEPFCKAIKKMLSLIGELKKQGISLKYFNMGGGLGIVYDNEKVKTAEEFAQKIVPLLKKTKLKIILEPGRFIAGNSGVLVSRTLYLKESYKKNFIIVDAAMNDLMRPSLYSAYHKILPVKKPQAKTVKREKVKKADIVGPVCESGDFLGKDRFVPARDGDFLVVLGAGAYGFSMSSNYNSRPRSAEVLVKGKKAYLIRKREEYKDLIDKEIII